LLEDIGPNNESEKTRGEIYHKVDVLIRSVFATQDVKVSKFGSVPLKTYLPDGDIDISIIFQDDCFENQLNIEGRILSRLAQLQSALERCESFNQMSEQDVSEVVAASHEPIDQILEANYQSMRVKNIVLVNAAEVKVIKFNLNDVDLDVSINQMGGVCSLCYLEDLNRSFRKDQLFKKSLIVIKAWCCYESRILGSQHGLIATYALEILIVYILNQFYNEVKTAGDVLLHFLKYYSTFDWDNEIVTICGPVKIKDLNTTDNYEKIAHDRLSDKDKQKLRIKPDALRRFREKYKKYRRESGNPQNNFFKTKFLNIIDPLDACNNLGRSISKANFLRIRSAMKLGYKMLSQVYGNKSSEEAAQTTIKKMFRHTLNIDNRGKEIYTTPVPQIVIRNGQLQQYMDQFRSRLEEESKDELAQNAVESTLRGFNQENPEYPMIWPNAYQGSTSSTFINQDHLIQLLTKNKDMSAKYAYEIGSFDSRLSSPGLFSNDNCSAVTNMSGNSKNDQETFELREDVRTSELKDSLGMISPMVLQNQDNHEWLAAVREMDPIRLDGENSAETKEWSGQGSDSPQTDDRKGKIKIALSKEKSLQNFITPNLEQELRSLITLEPSIAEGNNPRNNDSTKKEDNSASIPANDSAATGTQKKKKSKKKRSEKSHILDSDLEFYTSCLDTIYQAANPTLVTKQKSKNKKHKNSNAAANASANTSISTVTPILDSSATSDSLLGMKPKEESKALDDSKNQGNGNQRTRQNGNKGTNASSASNQNPSKKQSGGKSAKKNSSRKSTTASASQIVVEDSIDEVKPQNANSSTLTRSEQNSIINSETSSINGESTLSEKPQGSPKKNKRGNINRTRAYRSHNSSNVATRENSVEKTETRGNTKRVSNGGSRKGNNANGANTSMNQGNQGNQTGTAGGIEEVKQSIKKSLERKSSQGDSTPGSPKKSKNRKNTNGEGRKPTLITINENEFPPLG